VKLYASTNGTGAPLAAQTVVQTIVAGTTNSLAFTLNGVVASLSVFLQNPNLTAGQAASTNVVVNALDASGNYIVGPGAYGDANGNTVTITLADGDSSGATRLAQTTVTQPATVALTYNGATIASAQITATAGSLASASTTLYVNRAGTVFSAAAVTAALTSTANVYATMHHTNPANDINALAAEMVSSGAYTAAVVSPGGISGTLPDGTNVFVFTDRMEDLVGGLPPITSLSRTRSILGSTRSLKSSATSPHAVRFLVNVLDQLAFSPVNQVALAKAAATVVSGESVAIGVGLDDIKAIGDPSNANYVNLDLLDIATHGGVQMFNNTPTYGFASTTPITDANNVTYAADIAAGYLYATVVPTKPPAAPVATYGFTMAFLLKYVSLNPGAVVINNSCFGQSPLVSAADDAMLRAAGVGRYSGWTKSVSGGDADQSDAFLFDRLLGEDQPQPNGLTAFITQRQPLQRAFPLDDVQGAMTTEMRSGPFTSTSTTYAVSDHAWVANGTEPPLADGSAATLVVSDYGGETLTSAPSEYGFPSIATMSVAEGASGGTLTIGGRFQTLQGTVEITTSTGAVVPLPVTAWSTSQVTATLPATGAGSGGMVVVSSIDGFPSGPAPLTLWSGKLVYTENDAINNMAGRAGVGSGNVEIDYALTVRSDVAPTVTTIDTAPVAQNFTFINPTADSTAVFSAYNGAFDSNDGKSSATFTTGIGVVPMTPKLPPLQPGTFEVRAFVEGPPPQACNNGLPGVQNGPANILCPITGAYGQDAVFQCIDSGMNPVCPQDPSVYDVLASYGAPYDAGGQLTITMNPQTYALTAAGTTTQFESYLFGGQDGGGVRPATATMTGTFNAPKYAPTYALPQSSSTSSQRAPSATRTYRAHLQ
jgi:hypothetical protein